LPQFSSVQRENSVNRFKCKSGRENIFIPTIENESLHQDSNEELKDMYAEPNIVPVIKSRRLRWAGQLTRMGESRGVYRRKLRERDHLEDSSVDGRIILRWIFMNGNVRVWTGSRWLRIGTGGGDLRVR
jgi:hypothetical protein